MKMKKLNKILPLLGIVWIFSCTGDFEELNTNPNQAAGITNDLQFSRTLVDASDDRFEPWRTNFIYPHGIVQLAANPDWAGDFYGLNDDWTGAYFVRMYSGYGKNVVDLITRIRNNPDDDVNTLSAARIWKVYLFQRATDLHGDVPYSEAGLGFHERIFTPVYDSQQDIYNAFFSELSDAVSSFDASQKPVEGDVFFGGDIAKWQRFGNSLRLRAAMRLSKADPGRAESEAAAAVAAGVMTSNDDMPILLHDDIIANGNALVVETGVDDALADVWLSSTLVDYMQATNDPRLGVYGVVYDSIDRAEVVSTDPATYVGLDNGLDAIPDGNFASINKAHFISRSTPHIHMTYAEVELLMAEAAARGWIGSDAATHYANGIRAHMEHLALYPGDPEIASADIDQFLLDNPFPGTLEEQLQLINEQLWVSFFFHNGYEAFANWRRSGYPQLTPTADPRRTINEIPRRLPYPGRESAQNPDNFNQAIAQFNGRNDLTGRVWWDAE